MTGATLLFGVGATKAGTSWLHAYLGAHPQCHVRTLKELHYFDMREAGKLEKSRLEVQQTRNALAAKPMPADPARAASRVLRLQDMDDWAAALAQGNEAAYLAYLNAGRAGAGLVADITPAYALLPEGCLNRMAAMASEVRFVYLLRDPVERLWSHVRMIARRRAAPGEDIAPGANRILKRVLRGEETHITTRGDYRAVLGRLWAAVDPSQLLLAFYEELFSEAEIDRLCRFLGLAPAPAPLTARVHQGVPVPMSAAQRAAAAAFLAPQYQFVADRLGRVPPQWSAHRGGV